jgi:hypothetical protein
MNWFHRLTHRNKMEAQLDKELTFHIEQLTSDLTARGHSPPKRAASPTSNSADPTK